MFVKMNEEQLSEVVKSIIKEQKVKHFSLTKMEKVIEIAVKRAKELGVDITIVIMKNNQVIQMSYHMDNAILVSSTLASKKAWTALAMQQSTINLSNQVQPGADLYQIETMMDGHLTSMGGGIPLIVNDEIIGSIGVSGGTVKQDQAICESAVDAFTKGSD